MKQLGGVRKAYASKGDDVTLTRWIKLPGRGKSNHATPLVDANASGTRFPSRVLPVNAMERVLVSGHSNVKIGRDVRRGALRSYWIYTLSLEERATCPASCKHWRSCYGNAMPFAKRVKHGPELVEQLEREIVELLGVRRRIGILIRLHALGDFYSVDYVDFWARQLRKYPRLSIYGYTARQPGTTIGDAVRAVTEKFGSRFAIRFSDGGMPIRSTVSIKDERQCPPDAFVCPEQTGKTLACATCAACWSTDKNVAFLEH